MASALFVPADDQKNHQKHDGNCGIRSDGGGEQPAEQKARITVAARIVVVIIAAVVAAPAASAVAVGIFIKRTLKGHKYHPPVDPTTCEPLEDKDGKA